MNSDSLMAHNFDQLVEAVSHVPTDANIAGLVGGAAVAALGLYGAHKSFQHSKEQYALPFSNPALLEAANQAVGGKSGEADRTRPIQAFAAAAGFFAMQLAGAPTYSHSTEINNASVVAVVDVSTSMARTTDVGNKSRLAASVDALKTSDYKGKLGVVVTAESARPVVPLTSAAVWRPKLSVDTLQQVNPNGGDLQAGIELASNLLPNNRGNILVMSDGTIDQSAQTIENLQTKLHKQGTELTFVVPGTVGGTYSFAQGGDPVKVGIKPDTFNSSSTTVVDTSKELSAAVDKNIKAATTHNEKRQWPGFWYLGGAAALYGAARATKTLVGRRA